jgi:hypothetical protein
MTVDCNSVKMRLMVGSVPILFKCSSRTAKHVALLSEENTGIIQ